MPLDREIAELIADAKEHLLYLGELGVEDFRVELAEVSAGGRLRSVPPALAGGAAADSTSSSGNIRVASPPRLLAEDAGIHPSLDKVGSLGNPPAYAGGSDLVPDVSKPKTPAAGPAPGARLAKLPSLSKRKSPLPAKSGSEPGPSAENIEMAKAKKADAPLTEGLEAAPMVLKSVAAADDSLFGDVSAALPESSETMEDIWADIGNCTRCPLFEGRTQVVHTTGNFSADLMFVGEAPGANEDAEGEPFVGRAGQLLNKIIEAIGMTRADVAIGNINRCRPPGNRTPTLPEAHTCRPFLLREIAVIRPKVIVVLGNTALHNLLDNKVGITKVRGRFQDYYGVKVMPTFHPAYLLRDPNKKRETWEDMKMVRDYLASMK